MEMTMSQTPLLSFKFHECKLPVNTGQSEHARDSDITHGINNKHALSSL